MVKHSAKVLIVFLMLPSLCFADRQDSKLQKEYGHDLAQAPFFLRFEFTKERGKEWNRSSYTERKNFLQNYQANYMADQKRIKDEAKAQADLEKASLLAKKEEARQEREKRQQELAAQKAEKKALRDRNKQFAQLIKEEKKGLLQLRRDNEESKEQEENK